MLTNVKVSSGLSLSFKYFPFLFFKYTKIVACISQLEIVSVLLHELGHVFAFVYIYNTKVEQVMLMALGGATLPEGLRMPTRVLYFRHLFLTFLRKVRRQLLRYWDHLLTWCWLEYSI